jgi:hypothetical protein
VVQAGLPAPFIVGGVVLALGVVGVLATGASGRPAAPAQREPGTAWSTSEPEL